MAIEDIVINFHGGTAASVSGKTINNFEGISAGEFSSDLSGYDTGGATGVSISAAKALTAFTNGRFAGVDTLTQEVNQQSSFVDDSTAPSDNIYTATFPAGVTSLDVEIFLCVSSSNQDDLDGAANAETFTAFDSSNNASGATVQLTGVVPDGSDQVIINIDNQHATHDFTAHNGIRFHNIVQDSGVTVDVPVGSIALTGQVPTIILDMDITVSVPVGAIALSGLTPIVIAGGDISVEIPVGSIAFTGLAPEVSEGGFINDTFDGTGPFGDQWSDFDDSGGGVTPLARVSDYLQGTVADNTGNQTRWFEAEQGRFLNQQVVVPSSGFDEYVLAGAGVGPPTGDPLDDLPFVTNSVAFCGLMVHVDNMPTATNMFSVIGHRGSSEQSTIEIKGTTAGTSTVTDEGLNVFGTDVTHGDLAVEVDSAGICKFKWRTLAGGAWTYIQQGDGPGLVPDSFSIGTAGTTFRIGIIGYASSDESVPFRFTADSMTLTDPNLTVDVPTGSLTITGQAPLISVTNNQTVNIPLGAITLTGLAPFIDLGDLTISVGSGTILINGQAPIVKIGGAVWTIEPDTITNWNIQ